MNAFILTYWLNWVGVVFALGINGLLVAAALSLIKLRVSYFNTELLAEARASKWLRLLIDEGDLTFGLIRLGTSLLTIAFGLLLLSPLTDGLGALGIVSSDRIVYGLSIVLSFSLGVALHFIVAELVPRRLGLNYPLQSLKAAAPVLFILRFLARPVLSPLIGLAGCFIRLFGVKGNRGIHSLGLSEQLSELDSQEGAVSLVVQKVLRNAISLKNLVVSDILLPRNQVQIFDLELSNDENIALAKQTGHTRFPLCKGDLDHCEGLIHVKDLFRLEQDYGELDLLAIKREMIRVDSEEPLDEALSKLLHHNMHMALVIDEFRGVEGVLTLERLLEQLVGDIRDEFDEDEEDLIRPSGHDITEVLMDGLTPLHEIEAQLGVVVESSEIGRAHV